jgi:hypothetical protein
MDIEQFRKLWTATAVILPSDKRLELLWQMIAQASDLDEYGLRIALQYDQPAAQETTLLNLVEDSCSMPKVIGLLRDLRGEATQERELEFFEDSLTAYAAKSDRLHPVAECGRCGELITIPPMHLEVLNTLLALSASIPTEGDNVLLDGIRWQPDENTTCVLAIYNSPTGPYVDPFVVVTGSARRTRSLPPRKSLAEPFEFAGIGTFRIQAWPGGEMPTPTNPVKLDGLRIASRQETC